MKLSMTQYERVQRLSTNTAVVRSKINHQTFVAHTITIDQSEMWSIEKQLNKLQSIHDSSILKIHDYIFQGAGILLLIQDYCEEGSLASTMNSRDHDVMDIFKNVALSLRHLHSVKKRIHRALSLDNIFVRNGQVVSGGLWSILREDDCEGFASIYSGPETANGVYSYQTDIWALGVIFIEILTRKRLDQSQIDIIKLETQNQIETLLEGTAFPQLKDLIVRMLQNQQELRPNIEKVLQEIEGNGNVFASINQSQVLVERIFNVLTDSQALKCSSRKFLRLLDQEVDKIKQQSAVGNPQALLILGYLYCSSKKKDLIKEGRDLLKKAAEAGEKLAYAFLFNYYRRQQNQVALDFLRKGAELGDTRCNWVIARQLSYGFDGIQCDHKKALAILQCLPDTFPQGKYDIAWLKSKMAGKKEFTPQQAPTLTEGANMGHRRAVEALSQFLYSKGSHKKSAELGLICYSMKGGDCIADQESVMNRNAGYLRGLGDMLRGNGWLRRAIQQDVKVAKQNRSRFCIF